MLIFNESATRTGREEGKRTGERSREKDGAYIYVYIVIHERAEWSSADNKSFIHSRNASILLRRHYT